jgi:MFS transporter, MHS family, proline/betaine transporter
MSHMTVTTSGASSVVQRDSFETPRFHSVVATIFGNILEWFDFAAYAFFATIIARHFFPAGDEVAALMSTFAAFGVGFIARPLGAVFFGRLGDKRGRRLALLISMPIMGIGTLLVGLTPPYAAIGLLAPILLVFGRVLQGFAAGGEVGNAMAFLSEWAPPGRRGLYSGLQQCTAVLGTLFGSGCAALINSVLSTETLISWGWRLPFLIGGLVVAPLALFLRRNVEESPVFSHSAEHHPDVSHYNAWVYGAKSLALTAGWVVSFYVYLVYLPSFLSKFAGVSPAVALWANSAGLAAMVVAIPIAGAISDKIGRKPLLIVAALLSVVAPYPVFLLLSNAPSEPAVFGTLTALGALCGVFAGISPAMMSELFPTALRTTGVSVSFGLSTAIFGGFAPFISTWLISVTGSQMAPAFYLMGAAILSLSTLLSLRETADTRLE